VFRMGTADMLLHGAISFLLFSRGGMLLGLFLVMVAVTWGRTEEERSENRDDWVERTHACAALPTSRPIVVPKRTDDDIVLV